MHLVYQRHAFAFVTACLLLATSLTLSQPSTVIQGNISDLNLNNYHCQTVVLLPLSGWCVGCFDKLPEMNALYEEHVQAGVMFIGLLSQSAPDWSATLVERFGISYPVYLDIPGRETVERFGSEALPSGMFIFDREGNLVEYLGRFDVAKLREALNRLL
jgi:peroxiredoxin